MSDLKLIKISATREQLPAEATERHVAVFLPDHGLMFTATNVAENAPHAKCEVAAKACTIGGYADWTLPTIEQLQILLDRSRYSPAINTDFLHGIESDWYWTSTAAAWSSASAWHVGFDYGVVSYNHRGYRGFALAVRRVGQ